MKSAKRDSSIVPVILHIFAFIPTIIRAIVRTAFPWANRSVADSLKTPRQLNPDAKPMTGNEAWASQFQYPNGWHASSHHKVAAIVPEASLWSTPDSSDRSATLAFLALLSVSAVLRLIGML